MQDQQRGDEDMDMSGQGRAQSPGSSDNARSPKRQRVDGPFGGQGMGPGGRPASMAPQVNGLGPNAMMQNGLDPNSFPNAQFNGMPGGNFARLNAGNINQLQMNEAAMAKMGGMQPRGPMMGPTEGFDMPMGMAGNANGAAALQRGINAPNPNQQGGALADYQMQLMLLEQQNKKRLLMARQEQEGLAQTSGMPSAGTQAMMGQNMFAPGMSPRGSRNGHSPGANDQMRRGTPGGGQASPRPDGSVPATRGSPAPGFESGQMPPNYQHMAQMKSMNDSMMNAPNGPMMRPPGFNVNGQVNPAMHEMMRMRAGMSGQGGPMAGPGQPGQGNASGPVQNDSSQRNPMPPPQAPNNANNGRTQPSSPQQNPAPPTPGQGPKGNAKQKKETKEKKVRNRCGSTTEGFAH